MSADEKRKSSWAAAMTESLKEPRLVKRKGTVGVTTYIKSTLMNNEPFGFATIVPPRHGPKVKGPKRPKSSRDAGLCIGRITDKRFREVVARKRSLSRQNPRDARLVSIFAMLRRLQITPIATQVPVHCARADVHTAIDGLGISGSDAYVLELKCTQLTLANHRRRYTVPCRNQPLLANGMQNTEKMHHLLQAAFGVVGFRSTFSVPAGIKVHGLVVVSCADGVAYYTAPASLVQERHFCLRSPGQRDVAAPKRLSKASVQHSRGVAGKASMRAGPTKKRKKKTAISKVPLPFAEFEADAALMARLSRMGYDVPYIRLSPDERVAIFKRVNAPGETAVAIVRPGARVNRAKALYKMTWLLGKAAVSSGAAKMILARPSSASSGWKLESVASQ